MKENKQATVEEKLEAMVLMYYERYKEYLRAYNNLGDTRENVMKALKPLIDKGDSSSTEFKNLAKEHMGLNTLYPREVSYVATKFLLVAEIYQNVVEKELSQEMSEVYAELKSKEFRSQFSVEKGQFRKNREVELPKIPDSEFDFLFEYLKNQFDE